MKKQLRQEVYNKYGGLCAYTGKPLGDDWQIDHIYPKCTFIFYQNQETREKLGINFSINDIENLNPACKIINHYKRSLDLNGFRQRMLTFHKRLAKLPKKTNIPATQRRKEYMFKIAELFDITIDKPFDGKFYFEKI